MSLSLSLPDTSPVADIHVSGASSTITAVVLDQRGREGCQHMLPHSYRGGRGQIDTSFTAHHPALVVEAEEQELQYTYYIL